jgi:hypothetical protein
MTANPSSTCATQWAPFPLPVGGSHWRFLVARAGVGLRACSSSSGCSPASSLPPPALNPDPPPDARGTPPTRAADRSDDGNGHRQLVEITPWRVRRHVFSTRRFGDHPVRDVRTAVGSEHGCRRVSEGARHHSVSATATLIDQVTCKVGDRCPSGSESASVQRAGHSPVGTALGPAVVQPAAGPTSLRPPPPSSNAPDFDLLILPRSGATGAPQETTSAACRDMSRYQVSSGFSIQFGKQRFANSALKF